MIKINNFEIENVKRVKAVSLEPTQNGLTVIGGKNSQGKTSVLDSIAWCLGGDKFKPSQPTREGSVIPPHLRVELSNGIVVERNGNNSTLKVIDSNGNKGGQQLLNEFIEQLALNLPKFMNQTNKEKAATLLKIIGVGDTLYSLEDEEKRLYNQRHAIGQIADQKTKFAKEMITYPNIPNEPISATSLILQQQQILAKNGENQRKRDAAARLQSEYVLLDSKIKSITQELEKLTEERSRLEADLETAAKTASELMDESTAEIEKSINDIDNLNTKIRANLEKEKAEMDAEGYRKQYDELTEAIEKIRQSKTDLLNSADLPLEGLSVQDGELTYKGFKWDNMSASEQLKVATAIIRKLNPNCGFVLIDKLEQMDLETLKDFGSWLESQNLQAIATRVSTGEECSIIIEDGYAKATEERPKYKEWNL